jgi:hypothetical protein
MSNNNNPSDKNSSVRKIDTSESILAKILLIVTRIDNRQAKLDGLLHKLERYFGN